MKIIGFFILKDERVPGKECDELIQNYKQAIWCMWDSKFIRSRDCSNSPN
jgi:hypothetical protein